MTGKIYWAKMPLSDKKIKAIPESHRIRPYLILLNADKKSYYAFEATHKKPVSIAIESRYILCGNSQIKLECCDIIELSNILEYNELDENNNIIEFDSLNDRKYNELIKKLMINIIYDPDAYPKEVIDFVNKEYENVKFNNKDILYNGEKFIVCSLKDEKGYKVYDISFYAQKGFVEFNLNGNKCYLNPNSYYINDINDYVISYVSENLGRIFNSKIIYYDLVDYCDDVSCIKNMPIGSVIGYIYEEDEYILTKISQTNENVTFLLGRKGSYRRDHIVYTFDIDADFDYEFYNILSSEKLKFCLNKALN